MAEDELPNRVIADIAFLRRGGGWVRALDGFRKGHHSVPDVANATTQAFLAKICLGELSREAELLFQAVRAGLGYRRTELSLTVASPCATLETKDFSVEWMYLLEESDPARYVTTSTLRGLKRAALARSEAFSRIFAGQFGEISFALKKGARVEAIIDAIEALDAATAMTVDYPSDCRECHIRVAGIDAALRCTGSALEVVFPRAASPAELIDAFADVRDAFRISKALAGLIG
jgi:hypothetical protein